MVGRDEEIAELKAIAEGERSCLVVVYGRRRIRKDVSRSRGIQLLLYIFTHGDGEGNDG